VPTHAWSFSRAEGLSQADPSPVAIRLKRALWDATRRALIGGGGTQIADLAKRAGCSYAHAYELLTQRPYLLAWLLTPEVNLNPEGEAQLIELVEQVRAILELPIEDSRGNVLPRNANMILKSLLLLDSLNGSRRC